MKYKVLKGSKLFDSLLAIEENVKDCRNDALDLAKIYGKQQLNNNYK